jgi:hypothetical protein
MFLVFALSAAFFSQAAGPAASLGSQTTPLGSFLQAADRNDFDSMETLMTPTVAFRTGAKITSADFIKRISNCYLRRVYKNDLNGSVLAAWMCDEGQGKSRVVIGDLAQTAQGKIVLTVAREDRNNIPAPTRKGSAFAE